MQDEVHDQIPPFATTPVDPPAGYGYALTIDEIVGRLVGYEPQGMPYNEVLDAAIEQAGFKHQQAEIAGASADRLEALQARINHLGLRRKDAIAFDRELNEAADLFSQGLPVPHLILSGKEYPDGLPRFITTSAYYWVREVHQREIPAWAPPAVTLEEPTEQPYSPARIRTPDRGWADVLIQLLTNNRIRYCIGKGRWITKSLTETLFVDKRKSEVTTNTAYQLLTWLAGGAYFGASRVASGEDKAKRDKLCKALVDLVGIGGNPFTDRSPREGYKPHFTVEDMSEEPDQSAAFERSHEEYDPDREYGVNVEDEDEDEGW
jgi:hypothetical protein